MKRVFLLISAVASASIPQPESGLLVTAEHRPNSLLMSLMKKPRKLIDVEKLDEDDLERIMLDPESLLDNSPESSPFLASSGGSPESSPFLASSDGMDDFFVGSNEDAREEAPDDWWSQGWA